MTGQVPGKGERKRLVDLLAGLGLVDKNDLLRGLMLTRQSGSHLLRVIVDQGWVDEDRLTRALSSALGVEAVTPATMKIHERVLAMIPPKLAVKHRALPVAIKRSNQVDYLYVALADPLDTDAVEEIQRASNCRLHVLVAPPTQLDAAIQRFYAAQASSDKPLDANAERRLRPSIASATPPPKAVLPSPKPSVSATGSTDLGRPPIPAPALSQPGLPPPQGVPRPSVQAPRPRVGGTAAPTPSVVPRTPGGGTPRPPVLSAPALPGFPQTKDLPGLPEPKPVLTRADSRPPAFAPIDTDLVKTQLDASIYDIGLSPSADLGGPTLELPRMPPPGRSSIPEAPPTSQSKPKLTLPILTSDAPKLPRSDSEEGRTFDLDIVEAPALDAPKMESSVSLKLEPSRSDDEHPVDLDEVIDSQDLEEVQESRPAQRSNDLAPTLRPQGSDRPQKAAAKAEEDADEATSQVELDAELKALSEHFAGLEKVPSPSMPSPAVALPPLAPAPAPRHAPQLLARTMELPVAPRDAPSPFDVSSDLKAGLDRTAIIPVLDWDREGFDPPPMRPKPVPQLVSVDDIPSSAAAVRARQEVEIPEVELAQNGAAPADDPKADAAHRIGDLLGEAPVPLESLTRAEPKTAVTPAPLPSEPPPPPPTPARLPSAPPPPPVTVRARPEPMVEELPTNPRIPAVALSDAEASVALRDPDSVDEPVEKAAEPWEVTPANSRTPSFVLDAQLTPVAVTPESQAIVEGFMSGDSLTSSERAQLVLALGKVLLKKGIISKEELMRALSD